MPARPNYSFRRDSISKRTGRRCGLATADIPIKHSAAAIALYTATFEHKSQSVDIPATQQPASTMRCVMRLSRSAENFSPQPLNLKSVISSDSGRLHTYSAEVTAHVSLVGQSRYSILPACGCRSRAFRRDRCRGQRLQASARRHSPGYLRETLLPHQALEPSRYPHEARKVARHPVAPTLPEDDAMTRHPHHNLDIIVGEVCHKSNFDCQDIPRGSRETVFLRGVLPRRTIRDTRYVARIPHESSFKFSISYIYASILADDPRNTSVISPHVFMLC